MKRLLAVVVVILVALGVSMTFEAPWTLVTGWFPFLVRVLPRIILDLRTAAVGAAAFALFAAGLHWLGHTVNRRWRITWSLAVVAGVVVLFAAGICLIGVVHQTGWLLASPEPTVVSVERFGFASASSSSNQLRQIVLGVQNESDVYQGHFASVVGPDGTPLHSWVTPALPYIGYSSPIDSKSSWNSAKNDQFLHAPLHELINPELPTAPARDADGYGVNHYSANCHAMVHGNFRPLKELTNGTSTTLLIGEVNANFEPWGKPGNCRDPVRGINKSPYGFGGPPGSKGAYFAMADGSVRFISETISPDALKALATPCGAVKEDLLTPT